MDAGGLSASDDFALTFRAVNDAPTGNVIVLGNQAEDQSLMADTSTIGHADGLGAFSYLWSASPTSPGRLPSTPRRSRLSAPTPAFAQVTTPPATSCASLPAMPMLAVPRRAWSASPVASPMSTTPRRAHCLSQGRRRRIRAFRSTSTALPTPTASRVASPIGSAPSILARGEQLRASRDGDHDVYDR